MYVSRQKKICVFFVAFFSIVLIPDLGKSPNFKATYPDQSFESKKIPSQEQEKMAHELKNSKESTPQNQKASVHETKIKIEKHQHSHSNPYPDVVTYQMERSDIEDGIAETASGAVLSLALGLILTCIMALLIGCRLRVRRRMRKSGKSYAHDADYLVNGMYL